MTTLYLPESCLSVNLDQVTLVKFAPHESGISATVLFNNSPETYKLVGADVPILLAALQLNEADVLRDVKLKLQAAKSSSSATLR